MRSKNIAGIYDILNSSLLIDRARPEYISPCGGKRYMKKIAPFLVALGMFMSISVAQAAQGTFDTDLHFGIRGSASVAQLQRFLAAQGLYSGPITGNFFSLTNKAVAAFQKQYGITPSLGYFGSKTRSRVNAIVSTTGGGGKPEVSSGAHGRVTVNSKTKTQRYLRIFYYREGKDARASLFAHPHAIDVLAPQSYSFDSNGALHGGVESDILTFAKGHDIKVMPLVTNKNFSKDALAILDNPKEQEGAIKALIDEGQKQKFWGWQFDLEGMDASYRDRYSQFIQQASRELRQNDLVASVAVVAQISSDPNDYPRDLWRRIIGVYDYAALAKESDFISVMSYDNPDSKGPIAGYAWVKRVIDHSLQFIPKEKLSLGIPFYYWKWDDARGKLVGIGGYEGIANTLKIHHPALEYSIKEQSPFIRYTVKGKHYTLWYENARSIKKKLELISSYHLYGFSAWVLGAEVPNVYNVI